MKVKLNKNSTSFQRLMIIFTIFLSLIICITVSIFLIVTAKNYNLEQKAIENMAITKVGDSLQNQITVTKNIANYISENQQRIDNIHNYLRDDPAEYNKKILNESYQTGIYFNWPNTNEKFYINYPELTRLAVQFDDDDKASLSTQYNKSGRVIAVNKAFNQKMIYGNIISPQQQKVVGLVGTNFNDYGLSKGLSQIARNLHLQVLLVASDGRVLYHFADKSTTSFEKKRVSEILNNKSRLAENYSIKHANLNPEYEVYTIFDNSISTKLLLWRMLPIILGGLVVLAALIILFAVTFTRYRKQLTEIIKTTNQVRHNDLSARIPIEKYKYDDLNLLSESINGMLDEINNYINTIYKMKIAQQDAHMKALQAQISPHFMANTLEYIRMSALDIGAKDLAKVVFSFASLLRSNVDNQVQSTIKKEAKLIKNYIYLYQVRFPDKLAFQVDIAAELAQVKIPKFTLQPLVENYFKHGVNFANSYNAIEVKVFLQDNRVNLWVIDNGKQLTIEELSMLNLKLQEPISGAHSVGLQNVYARMANYTKNFKMMIVNNKYGGITVKLSFDYES